MAALTTKHLSKLRRRFTDAAVIYEQIPNRPEAQFTSWVPLAEIELGSFPAQVWT